MAHSFGRGYHYSDLLEEEIEVQEHDIHAPVYLFPRKLTFPTPGAALDSRRVLPLTLWRKQISRVVNIEYVWLGRKETAVSAIGCLNK